MTSNLVLLPFHVNCRKSPKCVSRAPFFHCYRKHLSETQILLWNSPFCKEWAKLFGLEDPLPSSSHLPFQLHLLPFLDCNLLLQPYKTASLLFCEHYKLFRTSVTWHVPSAAVYFHLVKMVNSYCFQPLLTYDIFSDPTARVPQM